MIRCSVIIPTCDHPDLLARSLEALMHQDLPPDEYEIIVCDDSGCDDTRALVESVRSSNAVAISYVSRSSPRQGPATMRNAGARIARGGILAFTDDDTVPEPGWLRQGLLALESEGADAASGRIVVPLPENPTVHERDAARRERAGFVTANCFCTRAMFESIGGFDPRFRTAWREDSDLFFRLLEAGADIVYAMDAIVVHPVRPVPWGVSLRAERNQVFDALLYKKHPHLYAQYIRPQGRQLYYGILAALGAAIVGASIDSPAVTVGGIGAWGVLTSAFVHRRLRATNRSAAHVAEVVVTSLLIPIVSVYHRIRGGIAYRVAFW